MNAAKRGCRGKILGWGEDRVSAGPIGGRLYRVIVQTMARVNGLGL